MAPREGPGVTFTVIGDNLLAAIHFLLSREAAGGTMRAGECQRVCGMIAAASAECGQSIEGGGEKCKAALSRRKKVVGKTSNKSKWSTAVPFPLFEIAASVMSSLETL